MIASRVLAGILACSVLAAGPAAAQDSFPFIPEQTPPAAVEEEIRLRVGDIFEIVADPGADAATYSWILTQERAFVEAGREKRFRYRFVQDKPYTLRAEVAVGAERVQRTIHIVVVPQDGTPLQTVIAGGTGAMLVGMLPHPDPNGRVVLKPEQRVLQLTPLRTDVTPLALDLDTLRDSDGDGNPGNDVDDTDTYFHSFGRSLWIWFARPLTQTELAVTGIPAGASPLVQRVTVLTEETARGQGVFTSPVRIVAEQTGPASFAFSPELAQPLPDTTPLLYEWEFGDGNRSLETTPSHTYAAEGPFTVRLRVRDLQTGTTIGETEQSVSPSVGGSVDEPEPDPVEEPEPDPVEEPADDDPLPWGRILLIGGIFVASILVGALVVWLLSFLRRSRKLEETLESMEQTIAPSKDAAPPPLAIRKPQASAAATKPSAGQQKVIDAEVSAASAPPAPSPTVSEESAPDWLKQGLAARPAASKAPPPAPSPAGKPAIPSTSSPAQPPKPAAPAQKPITPPTPAPAPSLPSTPPSPKPAPPQQQPKPSPVPTPKPQTPPRPAVSPVRPTIPAPVPAPAPAKPTSPTPPAPAPATPPASAKQTPAAPTPMPPSQPTPAPAPQPRTPSPATPPVRPQTPPAPPVRQQPPAVPTATPFVPSTVPQRSPSTPTPVPQPAVPVRPPVTPSPQPAPPAPQTAAPPARPAPSPAPAPTPTSTAPASPAPNPQADKLPRWLQPTPAPAPAPRPPSASPAPSATPAQPIPPTQAAPPAAPRNPEAPQPKKDDDPPIAFIRAESIGPKPQA